MSSCGSSTPSAKATRHSISIISARCSHSSSQVLRRALDLALRLVDECCHVVLAQLEAPREQAFDRRPLIGAEHVVHARRLDEQCRDGKLEVVGCAADGGGFMPVQYIQKPLKHAQSLGRAGNAS
jgi:hypothetical protein